MGKGEEESDGESRAVNKVKNYNSNNSYNYCILYAYHSTFLNFHCEDYTVCKS